MRTIVSIDSLECGFAGDRQRVCCSAWHRATGRATAGAAGGGGQSERGGQSRSMRDDPNAWRMRCRVQSMVVLTRPKIRGCTTTTTLGRRTTRRRAAAANALHLRQLQRVCRTRAILLGLSRSMGTAGQPRPTGWRQRRRERRSGRCAGATIYGTAPKAVAPPAAQPPAAQPAPARVPQPHKAPAAVPQNQRVTPPGVPIPEHRCR